MSKESDLYDPYNTKTIGGDLRLDVSTYENVQDKIHVESVNRKLLELTDLIGRVTNNRSDSGPIPNTGIIEQIVATSSGARVGGFQPGAGEVYQLYGFTIASMVGRSGSVLHEINIKDVNNARQIKLIDVTASSSAFPLIESGTQLPIVIDENLQVMYEATGTFDYATMQFVAIRVR